MRRMLLILAVGLSSIALAVPALAFVDVEAWIFKDKDKVVLENIHKVKVVDIEVNFDRDLRGAAEAQALANQFTGFNAVNASPRCVACGQEGVGKPFGIQRHALILRSINDNNGIMLFNQDVGNFVNQGNVVAFALSTSDTSVTNSQAEGDQWNIVNRVRQTEDLVPDPNAPGGLAPDRSARIVSSLNNNQGIGLVNQNVGNANNQLNLVALAVGTSGLLALSEAALGQVNAFNVVEENSTVKLDLISNSVNGNTGLYAVNQSSGNFNNQATAMSLAVMTSAVSVTTP